ncbi:MAG TPA: hypothetical protein VMW24_26285 [Sedimentisphaerales bacterium]|nr:hypothetical protein [Sedimentisphaerales bacterium]
MGNIKSLLVGFIVAFLLGIAGFIAIYKDMLMLGIDSFISRGFAALFTGIPLGSSLGIFITKMFLFRTGKFSVLCLFTSLVFAVLAAFLWPISDYSVYLLVPLFALIGYNAMEMLLRGKN